MRKAWWAVVVLTMGFGQVGCGQTAPDSADAASPDSDAGVTDADSGIDAAPAVPLGTVVVTEYDDPHFTAGGSKYYEVDVAAWFSPPGTTPVAGGVACVAMKPANQCPVLSTCTWSPTFVGAGTLSFSGGPFGQGTAVTPADAGSYPYDYGKTVFQMMAAGTALSVSASGGQVPAFSAQVTVPSPITVLNPQPYVFTAGQDMTFTWTGGESGSYVWIWVGTSPAGNCFFDATADVGTIPHELVGTMTGTTQVQVLVLRDATVWASNYPIDVQVARSTTLNVTFQ